MNAGIKPGKRAVSVSSGRQDTIVLLVWYGTSHFRDGFGSKILVKRVCFKVALVMVESFVNLGDY